MAAGKKSSNKPDRLRNSALSDALQTGDIAAVAFALRHGPTVVPLRLATGSDPDDSDEVWTYRDPRSGEVSLLLFSDTAHLPDTLRPDASLQSPAWLRAFLGIHADDITTVFLNVAGPHPMQATPADLIAALDA